MGLIIGPTPWWQSNLVSICPVGTTLPDGSRIICKAGGTAWIVAPCCTQVCSTWNNSTNTLVGNKPNVADWPTLCARMVSCGFNPSDWFVPSCTQISNPGFVCRTQWDPTSGALERYWTSMESNATQGRSLFFAGNTPTNNDKTNCLFVRAFRCVTY